MIGADGTPVIVDEPAPRVDKGKGVDPAERGDEPASPAQAATAFFASLQTSIAANPNLSTLTKNFQTSLTSAQTHLTQAQTQLQSNLAHLPAQLQQLTHVDPAAAEACLHKGESWLTEFSAEVQRLAKDAVRVVPPTSGEGDERSRKREERLRRAEEVSIGRTDVLVLKLRSEPAQLLVDPAQPHEGDGADTREHFARFLQTIEDAGGFEGAVWAARVAAETDEKLARTREELVGPGKLTPEAFWSRYFFRREEIDDEERRRKAVLLQGASSRLGVLGKRADSGSVGRIWRGRGGRGLQLGHGGRRVRGRHARRGALVALDLDADARAAAGRTGRGALDAYVALGPQAEPARELGWREQLRRRRRAVGYPVRGGRRCRGAQAARVCTDQASRDDERRRGQRLGVSAPVCMDFVYFSPLWSALHCTRSSVPSWTSEMKKVRLIELAGRDRDLSRPPAAHGAHRGRTRSKVEAPPFLPPHPPRAPIHLRWKPQQQQPSAPAATVPW